MVLWRRNSKKFESNLDILLIQARVDELHQCERTLAGIKVNDDVFVVTHDAIFGKRCAKLVRHCDGEARPTVAVLGTEGDLCLGQSTLLAKRRVRRHVGADGRDVVVVVVATAWKVAFGKAAHVEKSG